VPVIVGPSTFNFSEVAARAIEEKAAVQVMDFREGLERAAKLLGSAEALKEKSENAVRFASSYTGATERTMTVLDKIWKKQPLGSFPTF
jgi:3-deoxy-D-manno-octulosonic-acid transferase